MTFAVTQQNITIYVPVVIETLTRQAMLLQQGGPMTYPASTRDRCFYVLLLLGTIA